MHWVFAEFLMNNKIIYNYPEQTEDENYIEFEKPQERASKELEKMPCGKRLKGIKLFSLSKSSYTGTREVINFAAEA